MHITQSHKRAEVSVYATFDPDVERIDVPTEYRGDDRAALTRVAYGLDAITGRESFGGKGFEVKKDGSVGRRTRELYVLRAEHLPAEMLAALRAEAHAKLSELAESVTARDLAGVGR